MRNRRSFVWITMIASLVMSWPAMAQLPRVKGDTTKINHYEFSAIQAIEYAKKNSVQVKNALLDIRRQDQVNRELTAAASRHEAAERMLIERAAKSQKP